MEDDPPRIGVVGLGGMARTNGANIESAGAELVGGADVIEQARDRFGEEFDVPTYEEHEALYDQEDLDGVLITTPNAFHAPAAIAALERDINVLCEKPLADSLDAAQRMVDAETASDAFGMVGFQSRFSTPVRMFTDLRDRGRFGDLRHAESTGIRRRGIPGLGSWFTQRDLSGGGAVIDIGVHSLDRILHLLEFPEVLEVTAVTRSDFGPRVDYHDPDGWAGHGWSGDEGFDFDVEDSASAFIRCADGITIAFEIAWAANRKMPAYGDHVWGTEAGAAFGGGGLEILETDDAGVDHYVETTLSGEQDESSQFLKVDAFLREMQGESTRGGTFREGLVVQAVMDAIYRSDEAGRAIRLDD